ncbi:MAG TPA: hypothetical protein VHB99_15055, partial [Pirellulales bacterium]|nr:hypothetical protein [Pirellulales bacterium]
MSPDLLEHVHPDVRLRRADLPDRENARFLWEEAARHLSPVEIPEYEEFAARECMNEQDLDYWLPDGAAREKLREQIEQNRRALETANLGLSLGRFQFPEPRGIEHFAEDTALVDFFRQLTRIRDFKARLHASSGEFAQAARELASALRTAELALDGDGIIVNYLVGVACQGVALAGMRGLTRLPDAPAAAIAEMLVVLECDWQGAEALAQSMRADYRSYFVEQLMPLSACDSLATLVDSLLKSFYSDTSMLNFDEESRVPHPDGRSAWRRQRLLDLLAGHPSPCEVESTVSASSRKLAEIVRRTEEPWRPGRKQSEENESLPEDCWPTQLRTGFPYDMLGPGPAARKTVEELSESMPESARYWRVPDEAALATAREKLQQVDNPVGRLLAESAIGILPNCVDILF